MPSLALVAARVPPALAEDPVCLNSPDIPADIADACCEIHVPPRKLKYWRWMFLD